ncbi:MAG: endopeptidase, partial [bacterium]|nr:endopeptidase [bacterium]
AISGVVVEDNGRPAAGVWVNFAALHKVDVGDAITGTDGSFRAGTLGGGDDYRSDVRAGDDSRHDFIPADGSYPTIYVPNGESEISGVRIVIHRTHETISGTTVGADGQPLSDVQVVAFRAGATADERLDLNEWFTRPNAISGADGRFAITDLDSGTFVLRARAGDGAEGRVDGVAAGQQGVVVALRSSGGIDGQLVGFATPPDVTARLNQPFVPSPPAWATVSGTTFQLRGLAPGNYVVYADGSGGHDSTVVRVDAGQIATATLHDRGSGVVHGRVVEWRSGAPVEGLRCVPVFVTGNVRNAMHVDPGFSGGDGSFTLDGVARGPADVICGWSPDYSDGIANVVVGDGDASCELVVVKSDRPIGGLSWFGGEIAAAPGAGAHIASVLPGSPADKAGVKRGDVLATVDGISVAKLSPIGDEFAIRDRAPGSHVALSVLRNGKPLALDVVVTAAPAQ